MKSDMTLGMDLFGESAISTQRRLDKENFLLLPMWYRKFVAS